MSSRDKVEMWAMTRFNARRVNAFTSLMVGPAKTSADGDGAWESVPVRNNRNNSRGRGRGRGRGGSGGQYNTRQPTNPPSPRNNGGGRGRGRGRGGGGNQFNTRPPTTHPAQNPPPGSQQTVTQRPPSTVGGGWAQAAGTTPPPVSRQMVEQIANNKINQLVPGIVRNILYSANDNAVKALKNNILEAAMNEDRIKFGKIYESFLIHEISKHDSIPRYKGFTGSIMISNKNSVIDWVTTSANPQIGDLDVTSQQVKDFVNSYRINFENMINEYNAGTNMDLYANSKSGKPTQRRLRTIQRISRGYNDNTIPMVGDDLWLQRLFVKFVNPTSLNKVRTLYTTGWFGLVLNLEVDFAGHAWISTDANGKTIHHLHFGEIKSSDNNNTAKGGVTQMIRLGFIAMATMQLLGEGHYIRVEATLFVNDDEESFDHVSDFDPPSLTDHAKRVMSGLYIKEIGGKKLYPMPDNAQFILSYQRIRALGPDTRDGGDGYGTILTLYNNQV